VQDAIQTAMSKKARLPLWKMFYMAWWPGIYLGVSLQLMFNVPVGTASEGPVKILMGTVFSVGLMLIITLGAELFTGNNLIIIAFLANKVFAWEMVRDWIIVWLSNLVGSIGWAAITYGTGLNGFQNQFSPTGSVVCKVVTSKVSQDPGPALARAICCNLLVCVAVMLCAGCKTPCGKFMAVLMPIMMFISSGYEHSIANMWNFAMGTMLDCPDFFQDDIWAHIFIVTLGNMIGGLLLGVSYFFIHVWGTPLAQPHIYYDPKSPHMFHSSKDKPVEVPAPAPAPAAAPDQK
jgi:formate/nitrite transporter